MAGRQRKFTHYMADYETTVFEGQTFTEVWLAGLCELYTENAVITQSLDDWLESVYALRKNCVLYFHNIKFDGSFILDHLKRDKTYTEALYLGDDKKLHFKLEKELNHKEYTYLISDKGVFYNIVINYRGYIIRIIDSYKILPMSLAVLGKAFQTKHQKLDMEYEGYREANGIVKPEEIEYMKNDLFVGKECLEYMFDRGHKQTTIGSNCIKDYKSYFDKEEWNALFPNLYEMIPPDYLMEEFDSIGEYINKSYGGGWTYADPRFKDRVVKTGITADANSLYPSMMHSSSGNKYPIGLPTFWRGNIPVECGDTKYYFVRFRCRFELKENHLPFISIKGNPLYKANEMLTTSQPNRNGVVTGDNDGYLTLTMTCTDYQLFLEHYNVYDFTMLDGCYFTSIIGIFDEYINRYYELKQNAKTKAERTIAKLFLNNLYGRFAMYIDSSFKVAQLDGDILTFETVKEKEKKPGYIPIGSAITSYSRNCTIRNAQLNYDRFCYADTDSLHCIGREELKGITIHESALGCWKIEKEWDVAFFHRSKTYIEAEYDEKGKLQYEITCAGMGNKCKRIVQRALEHHDRTMCIKTEELREYTSNQLEFISTGMQLTDFVKGFKVEGNLKPVRIAGGIVLREKTFNMRF